MCCDSGDDLHNHAAAEVALHRIRILKSDFLHCVTTCHRICDGHRRCHHPNENRYGPDPNPCRHHRSTLTNVGYQEITMSTISRSLFLFEEISVSPGVKMRDWNTSSRQKLLFLSLLLSPTPTDGVLLMAKKMKVGLILEEARDRVISELQSTEAGEAERPANTRWSTIKSLLLSSANCRCSDCCSIMSFIGSIFWPILCLSIFRSGSEIHLHIMDFLCMCQQFINHLEPLERRFMSSGQMNIPIT
uniref:Uncharacterized protein n=1 Tax=Glossina austeni TaxID=7395 RepID=A0A1A9UD90_GLOAU